MTFSDKRYKTILILVAVLVRIGFILFMLGNGYTLNKAESFYPDSETYITPANSLLEQNKFLNSVQNPEIIRTPFYPLLIAVSKWVSEEHWSLLIIVIQYGMNIVAIFLMADLLFRLKLNQNAIIIACLLAALNVHDLYFAGFILTDSLSQSITFIGIYFFVRFLLGFSVSDLVFSMISFGISIFTRPSGLYLPLFLMIGILFLFRKKTKQVLKFGMVVFLCVYFPVLLWQVRNEQVAGYNGFSAITESNLYFYHGAGINAALNDSDFYTEQEKLKTDPVYLEKLTVLSVENAQKTLAVEKILDNLPLYIRLNIQGAGLILLYPGTFDIFRLNPDKMDFIDAIKMDFIQEGVVSAIRSLGREPLGILTVLNGFLLGIFAIITILGMIYSFKLNLPWYIPLAILGVFSYFLIVSAGPNGYGTYPRFRLSLSFIQAVYFGIFYDRMIRRKSKSVEILT